MTRPLPRRGTAKLDAKYLAIMGPWKARKPYDWQKPGQCTKPSPKPRCGAPLGKARSRCAVTVYEAAPSGTLFPVLSPSRGGGGMGVYAYAERRRYPMADLRFWSSNWPKDVCRKSRGVCEGE